MTKNSITVTILMKVAEHKVLYKIPGLDTWKMNFRLELETSEEVKENP